MVEIAIEDQEGVQREGVNWKVIETKDDGFQIQLNITDPHSISSS